MKQIVLVLVFIMIGMCLMAQTEPQNLIITRTEGAVTLSWDAVPGAYYYYIYRSTDPEPADWGALVAIETGTTHSEAATESKSFYRVTAISQTIGVFLYVPAGTFNMGDTRGGGWQNQVPVHSVSLSSFFLGKFEVSQFEWVSLMGSNPSDTSFGIGGNHPVTRVSWYDALQYCNLRSLQEGLTPVYSILGSVNPADWGAAPIARNTDWDAAICNWTANGYRLPTEAEWEYASRGAAITPDYLYSGSEDVNAVSWHMGNSSDGCKPIGTKAPNSLGLHDMSGNVLEWCWDGYAGYTADAVTNPTGPADLTQRIGRSGSWGANATYSRVSYRAGHYPWYRMTPGGFRLCRTSL